MKKIKNYPQKSYAHPVVAVDVVIFSVIDSKLQVLLLELDEPPFAGKWALPGGLVSDRESLEEAVSRHLETKAGIKNAYVEQLYTFGEPDRDPKGWVTSVAYMALISNKNISPKTQSRYRDIAWKPVKSLPEMAYDHKKIITKAFDRLRSKLSYTNIVYTLLPKEFTMSQLQELYETILAEKLDKRNFRKKIHALGIVEKTGKKTSGDAHRPALLYRFSDSKPVEINIL